VCRFLPVLIYLCSESTYDAEFLHLMRGKEGSQMTSLPKISWLDQGQLERVVRLEKLPVFKGLVTTVESSEVSQSCGSFTFLLGCSFSLLTTFGGLST